VLPRRLWRADVDGRLLGEVHKEAPALLIDQTWPSTGTVKFKMVNFVRMPGGEYFFAPSMRFLKGLAQP
jgi:hypothetical protein